MSTPLAVSVEAGRVVLCAEPGVSRPEIAAIIQHARLAFGAPAGSSASGWTVRSVPIQAVAQVSSCLNALVESGHHPRLQPGGAGRTVMMIRIDNADNATARLHWGIELEMAELTAVGPPSVTTDDGCTLVMGLVEPTGISFTHCP